MSVETTGPALRKLRDSAGLTQQQLAEASGVGFAMISRYERGIEAPSLRSLDRLLGAMGVDFRDLADAIDSAAGVEVDVESGSPRPEWVAALVRHGIDEKVLTGIAISLGGSAEGAADLVASAREAAAQLAYAALEEVRTAEARLEVAEPPGNYDARRKRR